MAKVLKTVGKIAGVVATIAAVIPGGQAIAAIAAVVSFAASAGAAALAKPPPARGSITQVTQDPNAPAPYVMGEGYYAGVLRHDVGYGPTIKDVPNPYRFMAIVYSVGGPAESITPQADFANVSSWFNNFLYTDVQLGAVPESDALSPQWSGAPNWGSDYKLSGQVAIGWSFKFDKDGKRFASGPPVLGAYGKWVKVYDPRKDSTQPGGIGSHRLGNESTYEWSENPALHAGTYCYGRYQNGKRVMGVGLPADGIDWVNVMAWANVCDANGWKMFGVVYEGGANESERRWANLKDICFAGGAQPIPTGVLSFKYAAPVVALDTITEDDLTGDDQLVTGVQSFRDRLNTVIPQYRSPAHNWELDDAEPVVNSTFLAEDGEEKREVWPFNFVKDATQAAQLAAYRLFDTREIAPIVLVCKPRLRAYRPGECLHLDIPELGLDVDAIILTRTIDPTTMSVTFELMSETPEKHAYCLGRVGVAPPTPALGQTSQERDETAAGATEPAGYARAMIGLSYVTDADPADGLLQGTDTQITIETHNRSYPDKTVSVTGGVLTVDDQGNALVASTTDSPYDSYYNIYYDDVGRSGGVVVLKATANAQIAANDATNPRRHYIGTIAMDVVGGSGTTSGGASTPPGWEPDTFCVSDDTPILHANGEYAPAAILRVGDMLRTRHETTMEWGDYPIEAIDFIEGEVFMCKIGQVSIRATGDHRFYISGQWIHAKDIGEPAGIARVAKITVSEAHTYISDGVLSHNIKAGGPGGV
mgnify:CR=1 FL=1